MRWFKCQCGNLFSEDAQNRVQYDDGQCPECGSDDIHEVLGNVICKWFEVLKAKLEKMFSW